jgi:YidC/Oxa1 family membrane protein insertase
MMMVLPILFVPFIIRFPAGLVLYWMTTNLWTVGQGLITRRLIPKTPAAPAQPKKSSRTPPKDQPPPDDGNGATPPKPKPSSQPPRQVRRKKKQPRARR